MRTTLAIEDELLVEAQKLSGIREKAPLVREALKALIERRERGGLQGSAALSPDSWPRPGAVRK
jgi:Arc/MetJ family transcription regulator